MLRMEKKNIVPFQGKNECKDDIYEIDTNGMDLSKGIDENEALDMESIRILTHKKIQSENRKVRRNRFKNASNMMKAAVIAGVILVSGVTVAAAYGLVKYIPNVGVTKEEIGRAHV